MKPRLVLLPILGLLLAACAPTANPESITVTSADGVTSIEIGETLQLSATVNPEGAPQDVSWSSATPTIATVSETGLVTGVSGGNVIIRATSLFDTDLHGSFTVTVEGASTQYDTIAEAVAKGVGATITTQGVVVAKVNSGLVISDNTATLYRYDNQTSSLEYGVGDFVKVSGALVEYPEESGIVQLDYNSTIAAGEGTAPTVEDTPTVMDAAAVDAWVPSNDAPLATITAKYVVSGTYQNGEIAGSSRTLSILSYPGATLEDGKTYAFTGYLLYISGSKYVNMAVTSFEETTEPTPPEPEGVVTIAEAYATADGTTLSIEGVLVAKTNKGLVIDDETGTMFVYNTTDGAYPDYSVGDYVRATGPLSTYNGAKQLGNTTTLSAGEGTRPTLTHTTPTVWTATEMDAFAPSGVRSELVKITGTVGGTVDFNTNVTVEGATRVLSPMWDRDTITVEANKTYDFTGYALYVSGGKYLNIALTAAVETGTGGETPDPEPSGDVVAINDAHALEDGTPVVIEGVLVAKTSSGLVIDDNTGTMYVYQGTTDLALNSFVHVEGSMATFSNARQISSATVTAATGTAPVLTNTTPTPMDGAAFDAWTPSGTRAPLVSLTATITSTGKYTNASIEGASKQTLSPLVPVDVTPVVDTTYDMVGYLLYISGTVYTYMACVSMEEADLPNPTAVEITNTETTLMQGNNLQLNLAWTPELVNNDVAWTSSNDEIATVSETGLVTAVAAGEVDITVTSTVVATVTDSIHLTVTAAVASNLLVEVDLSTIAYKNGEIDATTIQQLLLGNAVTEDAELTLSVTASSKVYQGGQGGYHAQGEAGYLKFGTGSAQGTLDVTLNREIVRVEIDCVKWNDSAHDTIALNSETLDAPAQGADGSFGTLSWNIEAATDLSLVVTNRAYVSAIRLYVAAA